MQGRYGRADNHEQYPKFSRSLSFLQQKYPGMKQVQILLPSFSRQATTITFSTGENKKSRAYFAYFINGGTDKIMGYRDPQNTIANFLRQIHARLYERSWGRQLVGLGGVAFLVITITGFFIYSDFMKKQRYPNIRKDKGMRIMMGDWHKILGITAIAFNFVFALTGAWLGLQPIIMKKIGFEAPNEYQRAPQISAQQDNKLILNWPQVFKQTKAQFPELIPRSISLSDEGSASLTIQGNIPGLVYERNINTLILDKRTTRPVYLYDVRAQPFCDKLFFVQEALHFGDFGGLAVKALYAILGLLASFLSISGFIIYLFRTEKKQKRQSGSMKIVFLGSAMIILLLSLTAMITLLFGYDLTASILAILINTLIISFLLYKLYRYAKSSS